MKDTPHGKIWVKYVALLLLLFARYRLGCPFYRMFGICCPGCGLTRAWKYALSGEIVKAFETHSLFLLAPLMILLFFLREAVSERYIHKMDMLLCALGVLFFVFHLLRGGAVK